MNIESLINRYGTDTISLMLIRLADDLRDRGCDIDPAPIKDMANDLKACFSGLESLRCLTPIPSILNGAYREIRL